jgi:hypothetical protein
MRLIRNCLLPFTLLTLVGCNLPPGDVWMYVDNGGKQRMDVWVDGKEVAKIPPGEVELVKCKPGEHDILVKCGERVVLECKKELPASDRFAVTRKFVLDPHKETRYAIFKAEYGSNPFKGMFRAAVMGASKTPVDETRMEYLDLLKQVEELPAETLVDAKYAQYMLTDPPDTVYTRSSSEERTVLTRIDAADHAFLAGARLIKDPTEEEVEELAEVVERILFTPQGDE